MSRPPIMRSMLDNDLYKFTMMQAVLHHHPSAIVEYKFKCRTDGIDFRDLIDEIKCGIKHLEDLRCTEEELEYLSQLKFLTSDFIQFLRLFRYDTKYVSVHINEKTGEMDIRVTGPWLHTILFEVPILAIVSEVYSGKFGPNVIEKALSELKATLNTTPQSGLSYQDWSFSDLGTRRRHSFIVHDSIVSFLTNYKRFMGTSNVYLAMRHDVKPMGTQAHEWFQAHQQLGARLEDSQKAALETWVKEYRGQLGIALTDVIGIDQFLVDFDLYFAKLFDGVRHDSGDPVEFGEKMIQHYVDLGIDTMTKTLVFSDGLDFKKIMDLYIQFHYSMKVSFGIGTNLTNRIPGEKKPIQIVMKMVKCNGRPVAKISDNSGKRMCEDAEFEANLRRVFNVRN